ncbi:MAG: transglutaminase-like domain-containing protein [Ruminococcus sp.]
MENTYVFDLQGRLLKPSKSKIVQVGKKLYYVNKKGQAIKGFFKIGNKLYRGDIKGRLTKNKTVANVTFNSKGYAKNDLNAKLKMKLMTIISRITTTEMSKSEKLYSCWRYLTSSGNFYYSTYWPDLNKKGWQREVAYNMLTTGGGDCYGFACTFAAMARELGYNPYVVLGRVSGTRDGAADGLTRHGWVMIDGAYYDPEAQFAGWYRGVYGNGSYDINHTISRYIRYAS